MRKLTELIKGCKYSEETLTQIFEEFELDIPKKLKEFYLHNSAQKFLEIHFKDYNISGWFFIKTSICNELKISLSLSEILESYKNKIPQNLIPFAYNDLNDYFLISIKDNTVYFLRNDLVYSEKGALIKIADCFEEFINELK